jgi:hypothetical protein
MQGLCEAFPWNNFYWTNLTWFHEQMALSLRPVDLGDQANEMLLRYRNWLAVVAPSLPADAGAQENLQEARSNLIPLLRTAGLDRDADALAATLGEEAP